MISFDSTGARVFIETNADATIVTGETDNIVVWNPAAYHLFGWTKAEAMGRSVNELIIPSEMRTPHAEALKRLTARVKAGETEIDSNILDRRIEIDALHKRGHRFPVELSVSMFKEDSELFYVARLRDLREKREADRMHEVMMHELNHRVRNSLAIAQSLVTNTLNREGVNAEVIRKVTDRIAAMSRAHSILAEENWQSGSLWNVVREALGAYDDRIKMHGPDPLMCPTGVVTISLVLHELATNAVKYGALSNAQGQVTLTWFLVGSLVRFFWQETGGPTVHKPTRAGFGTRLMERLVRAENNSRITFDFDPAGVRVELELPFLKAN